MRLTQLTQPTKYSCVTTSLAMLLGHDSPDGVVARFHPEFWSGRMDVYAIMDALGIKWSRPQRKNNSRLQKNKTYLVSVPSLNIPGGMHQVVFQVLNDWNIVVFDPAKGRVGRKFYQSTHLELTHNSVYPVSWDVDAEIYGIELTAIKQTDSMAGIIASAARQESFIKDHDYDFNEFLERMDRPYTGENYELAS